MSGLPAGHGHAFARLISRQLHVCLTNGFLFWVATFFLPRVESILTNMGVESSAWHVQSEGLS